MNKEELPIFDSFTSGSREDSLPDMYSIKPENNSFFLSLF